jgi:proteic killer suppression protein
MIRSFKNQQTYALFTGVFIKGVPDELRRRARAKLLSLNNAQQLEDLKLPTSNHLEALVKNRIGQHSIRVNNQWRLVFSWTSEGPEDVEFVDYH